MSPDLTKLYIIAVRFTGFGAKITLYCAKMPHKVIRLHEYSKLRHLVCFCGICSVHIQIIAERVKLRVVHFLYESVKDSSQKRIFQYPTKIVRNIFYLCSAGGFPVAYIEDRVNHPCTEIW